ncbi:MAG: tetratricopeptide repeat protein [Chloroflexota bacterium]
MKPLLARTLILLAVFGLVAAPPLSSGNAALRRAVQAYQSADYSTAAVEYERAARLLPWRADLWEWAGLSASLGGESGRALAFLETAHDRDAVSTPQGWDFLGLARWETGDFAGAQSAWNEGSQAYPDYTLFLYRLALAARLQGDRAAEQDALTRWLSLEEHAPSHYRLGLLLISSDTGRALSELMAAARLDPAFDPAIQTLRTTLNLASLETDESRRLVVLARGLGLVNEWELAVDLLERAVQSDPRNAEAWAWLGEARDQLGEDGLAELERARDLDPQSAVIHSLLGLHWKRVGEPRKALIEFDIAAQLDPENPAMLAALGEAYAAYGDLPLALAAYQQAANLDPDDPVYWRLLSAFCVQYNMLVQEVGLPAAFIALDLDPKNALSYDTLGQAHFAVGLANVAELNFIDALRLDPDLASAHLHLAMVYLQRSEWEAAREHLVRARDLDDGEIGQFAAQLLAQYFP